MDDGRLTDGQGRTVDFKNTVLIMTSNFPVAPGLSDEDLRAALLEQFKPEFINRLDDIVRFESLTREQLTEIVDLQVARVIQRVAERGVSLTLTDEAKQLLGNMGYDPTYGARPLRRVIQKQLIDRLALALLQGEIRDGDAVRVDAADGELVLEKAHSEAPAAA
jgi:ATP-dependent Clp protease ATP-binding subunit ClpB